jgi:hypothetical protein
MPEVDGVDIREVMKQMGDRRGYYMPRMRLGGRELLWAHKEGENPRLETFDNKGHRAARAATLRKEGYTVELTQSNTPSEDAFGGNDILAMNDLINNALERMKKNENLTFGRFGLEGRWIDYPLKSGKTEKHFTISGEKAKSQSELLKSFGGQFYEEAWHFKNIDEEFEKIILSAIAHNEGAVIVQTEAIGQALAEQMAVIIHSHGSRSHKIKRDNRTGKDVYLGFEEDIIKAVTLSGTSIAGGTAKRIMAKKMIEAFTGHDLKWNAYKNENLPAGLKVGSKEYYDAMSKLWQSFEDEVKKRSIDSSKQPIAYREARAFMNDMLRNDEKLDRAFGFIKSAAALKYLSGFSSGIINLTSLATSVPAAIHGIGGVPASEIPGLLSMGASRYVKYVSQKKLGREITLSSEQKRLFDDITKRGWDADLQNQDLTEISATHGSKEWNAVVKYGLIVFSTTEQINRASTIAAAFNGMAKQHKGELSEVQREAMLLKAKEISDKAHGVYGKINLPAWARGPSLAAHIGKSMYMYKNYMHNYYQLMWELGATGHKKDVLWMMVAPAIIAGVEANALSPILKPILAGIISGLGGPDDPEEALYQWLEEKFGMTAGRFARTGLAGGLLGINLKGSMAAGSFETPTMEDLGGVPLSFVKQLTGGIQNIARGNILRGIEDISPRPIATIAKSYRERTEGVTTKTGKPVFWGNQQLKPGGFDTAIRSLGFNPAGISEKRETQWSEKQIEAKYSEMRSDLYDKFRIVLSKDGANLDGVLAEIKAYNDRVISRGLDNVPLITRSSLRSVEKKMNVPEKRERTRGIEDQKERKIEDLSGYRPRY